MVTDDQGPKEKTIRRRRITRDAEEDDGLIPNHRSVQQQTTCLKSHLFFSPHYMVLVDIVKSSIAQRSICVILCVHQNWFKVLLELVQTCFERPPFCDIILPGH